MLKLGVYAAQHAGIEEMPYLAASRELDVLFCMLQTTAPYLCLRLLEENANEHKEKINRLFAIGFTLTTGAFYKPRVNNPPAESSKCLTP